jgi:hypothetical protein
LHAGKDGVQGAHALIIAGEGSGVGKGEGGEEQEYWEVSH